MIRRLTEPDLDAVSQIVNENWKTVYSGYVSPALLEDAGCRKRAARLKADFLAHRFEEFVWEENGEALALLSVGDCPDPDMRGAFEIARLYVAPKAQGKGIGGRLIAFAEQCAREKGYPEIVIWAFRENARAVSFYKSCGYHIGRTKYLAAYRAYGIRLHKRISPSSMA